MLSSRKNFPRNFRYSVSFPHRRLKECLSENDMEGAYEAVHTLKGTSGTLGMYELADSCDAVCKKLRNGESDFDLEAVYRRYETAARAIESME